MQERAETRRRYNKQYGGEIWRSNSKFCIALVSYHYSWSILVLGLLPCQVKTINIRENKRLERRISVGSDLAFSGTYTGPAAAAKGRKGRGRWRELQNHQMFENNFFEGHILGYREIYLEIYLEISPDIGVCSGMGNSHSFQPDGLKHVTFSRKSASGTRQSTKKQGIVALLPTDTVWSA